LRDDYVEFVATVISPDGRWLATAAQDGTTSVWNLRLDDLIALARRAAGRLLSDDERLMFHLSTALSASELSVEARADP
jgi:hypothetical protein